MSDEVVRKTSGRHAGGSHLTVEFRSDEPGPEDLRLTVAYGGLHIARQEDISMARGSCLNTWSECHSLANSLKP